MILKNKKVYISGPITGAPYIEAWNAFENAEIKLKALGFDTINPMRICDSFPKNTTHEEYMSICYPLIDMSCGVILLDGWKLLAWRKKNLFVQLQEKNIKANLY